MDRPQTANTRKVIVRTAWLVMHILSLGIAALLCGSGCASTRFTTTIHKVEGTEGRFPVKFRIESVEAPMRTTQANVSTIGYTCPDSLRADSMSARFGEGLMSVATARYPHVFSASPEAIPLRIEIESTHSSNEIPGAFVVGGSVLVFPVLLPFPFLDQNVFSVKASLVGAESQLPRTKLATFTRKDYQWVTLFTPLGLCPIPGESDVPKVSSVGRPNEALEVGGDLTLSGYVDAIVTVLMESDMEQLVREYQHREGLQVTQTAPPTTTQHEPQAKLTASASQPMPHGPQVPLRPPSTQGPAPPAIQTLPQSASAQVAEVTDRPAERGQRWAVIVGVSDYKDTRIPSLRYASADARALYEWAVSRNGGGYAPARVKLLLDKQATYRELRSAFFIWLKQALEEDVVTVFFAGHGCADSPDSPENLFLLPYDAEYDSIAATGFPMEQIGTALERYIRARKVIIIADACHSGGVGQSFDIARRASRGLKVNPISNGVQDLSKIANGVCVICASDESQYSQESKDWGGGHGVFTHFLLKGLQGNADFNQDTSVTLGELTSYLSQEVRRATKNAQSPTVAGRYDPALTIGK